MLKNEYSVKYKQCIFSNKVKSILFILRIARRFIFYDKIFVKHGCFCYIISVLKS